MTLDQLRVFLAVAERQHVTRAAQALGLGQPAVSAAIAALEASHGVKLFNRVGRGISLTQAGEAFLGSARLILAEADAAALLLGDLGAARRGRLIVQASQTIASYWLPRHLVEFRRGHAGIEIRLTVGNTAQVAAAVHQGVAELGFVEGAVNNSALKSAAVARDRMMVVVGHEHPWVGRPAITPAQLPHSAWVLREPGSGTRSAFEDALAGFGMSVRDLQVAMELPSNEAVRAAVEAGLGATSISASVAAPSLEAGLLHAVNLRLPERSFHALWHRERFLSPTAKAFLAQFSF